MIHFLKQNKGITAFIFTMAVLLAFVLSPFLAENIYRKGLFQVVRLISDYSVGLLPFPLIYLLLPAIPFFLYFYFRKFPKKRSTLWLFPSNFIGWLITIFFWTWGFNYTCPSHAPIVHGGLSTEQVFAFGKKVAVRVNELSHSAQYKSTETSIKSDDIRKKLTNYLFQFGLGQHGNVHVKTLTENGFIRRLGIAGIYMPFCFEGYCDPTFLPAAKTFVIAHEMSHAWGISGEGEADFTAYSALKSDPTDTASCYLAQLELLRTIRGQLHVTNEPLRLSLDSLLEENIKSDLKLFRENNQHYPEFFPGVQTTVNDKYLKLMGVQGGVLNYDAFLNMVYSIEN
jgi:Protein of unknown function (DUF3810)